MAKNETRKVLKVFTQRFENHRIVEVVRHQGITRYYVLERESRDALETKYWERVKVIEPGEDFSLKWELCKALSDLENKKE